MRKLIRSILEWAVSEPKQRPGADQMSSANLPSREIDEIRSWHGQRLENLEINLNLLMNHLNVRVVNKGKQIEEGKTYGGTSEALSPMSPANAGAAKIAALRPKK